MVIFVKFILFLLVKQIEILIKIFFIAIKL